MNTQYERIKAALLKFVNWLSIFGETSFDHQSFYIGPIGSRAKRLYYRKPALGLLAVGPMVFFEAFIPSARQMFWRKIRLPIADAHYAMGFIYLYRETGNEAYYRRAIEFLDSLIKTRSHQYARYCWGYPFDWVTQGGIIVKNTPLITTTPYVYEAFESVHSVDKNDRWLKIMRSIAEHVMNDFEQFEISPDIASSGYCPGDSKGGVVNASAYRAFLLTQASIQFGEEKYWKRAERFLNYVLQAQYDNGSWPYATESERDFIDHFHTCFVLKSLVKIEKVRVHKSCSEAIEKGIRFYLAELFDEKGFPKPFYKAPRLTVYRNELYDYAECINIGLLLSGRFRELDRKTEIVINDMLERWQKKDGSFRSRKLMLGWDNIPMHRWGQSQIFRSLCLFLSNMNTANS